MSIRRPVLRLRDEIIPIDQSQPDHSRRRSRFRHGREAVHRGRRPGRQKLGINIDRFLGQEEVVIKSLGTYLGSTEGVAGATILGDGRIRLIVDLMGLFNMAEKTAIGMRRGD